MGFFERLRRAAARIFRLPAPPPPRPAPPPPVAAARPAATRQRRKARGTPRQQRAREVVRARAEAGASGTLQLGSARPHARALYPGEIERIWRAAPEVWPGERWFVVAIYARYTVGEPGDKFWGSGSIKVLGQSYGRPVGVNFGRRYWGWRGVTVNRRQLVEFPYQIAFGDPSKPPEERQGILQSYGGIRPIHAVSVRPAHLE